MGKVEVGYFGSEQLQDGRRRFQVFVPEGSMTREQIEEALEKLLPPDPVTLEEIGRATVEKAAAYHGNMRQRVSDDEYRKADNVLDLLLDRWFEENPDTDR